MTHSCPTRSASDLVDGLTKVHAAGQKAERKVGQGLPAQRWRIEAEMALVMQQPHARFAERQAGEVRLIQPLQVGEAQVQQIAIEALDRKSTRLNSRH